MLLGPQQRARKQEYVAQTRMHFKVDVFQLGLFLVLFVEPQELLALGA